MEEHLGIHTSNDGFYPRLSRLLNLVQLLNNGLQQNARELGELLGVSRRTIFRDIQTLQEAGVPLAYDSISQKYRLERVFQYRISLHVPDILSFAIVLATAKISLKLNAAVTLFESEFSDRLSRSACSMLQSATEWLQNERSTTLKPVDLQVQALFVGYLSRTKVRITYEIADHESQGTLLSLYALVLTDCGFEVSGWSSFHRKAIRIELDKIVSAEATDEQFSLPARRLAK